MRLRAILSLFWLSFCFVPTANAEDAAHIRGQAIAERLCARCHATGRSGGSPVAKAPPMRDIGKRYPPEFLAEALAEGIRTGHAAMPEFKFAPHEVGALIAYLKEIAR